MIRRIACAVVALLPVAAVNAEDWPRFLGPRLDGIARPTSDIVTTWPSSPPILWEKEVGAAFSSFAVVGERLYTCGTRDKHQVLLCLNARTGDEIWALPFESAYKERQGGDGTRATPTYDEGRIYLMGALGRVICVNADNGELIWSREFKRPPTWGYSGSVLIEGDLAVVTPGGADGALLALDKQTGKDRWKAGDAKAGYATPYPFTHNGQRYIAGFVSNGLLIVNAANGTIAGRVDWKTDWDVNAATPIYHEGRLWIGSGYKTGSALYEIGGSSDRLSLRQLWMQPDMLAKFQSPVLYDGHLYMSDQNRLKCVEWNTGKEVWTVRNVPGGRSIKDSTVLIANQHLFVQTEAGELVVAPVSSKGFEPSGRAEVLDGRCWTVPVIHDGLLYTRNLDKIVCLDLCSGK